VATEKPTATKVSQVAFAVESVSLGCVALTLVPGALLALLSADFLFGLGVVAVIVGFSGLAVALWILGQKVIGKPDLWTAAAFAIEIPLIVIGWETTSLYDRYTRQHPYTEGPFADGSEAAIGLAGLGLLVAGLTIIFALLWRLVVSVVIRGRRGAL